MWWPNSGDVRDCAWTPRAEPMHGGDDPTVADPAPLLSPSGRLPARPTRPPTSSAHTAPPSPAPTMPAALIAPSVLASDMGALTAECKRMIDCGADWLHMGAYDVGCGVCLRAVPPSGCKAANVRLCLLASGSHRRDGWVRRFQFPGMAAQVLTPHMSSHFVPNIVLGAPILASISKTLPDAELDCHMMVSAPAKVRELFLCAEQGSSRRSLEIY